MSKKKSIIIVGIVAVILAVVLIVVLHPSGTGKDAENKMEVTTANYQTDEADDNNSMDNESAEGETNYWDSASLGITSFAPLSFAGSAQANTCGQLKSKPMHFPIFFISWR